MDALELKDKLANAFRHSNRCDQLLLTKQAEIVKSVLKMEYGEEALTLMINLPSGVWKEAWTLFEQHHGIYTHCD